MQSDQKIGVCLLIALTGFGLALGFGRRESPAETAAEAAELTPAAEVLTLAEVAAEPEPTPGPQPPVAVTLPPPPPREAATAEPEVAVEPPAADPPTTTTPPAAPPRTYVVQPGDTLSGIAARELGSVHRYGDIFEANRAALGHPDALRVGQTIVLPVR